MKLTLADTFVARNNQSIYTRNELMTLVVRQSAIQEFAKQLAVFYVENEREGNVCFMNNKELQPEYKNYFTKPELIEYISSVLKTDNFDFNCHEISYPCSTFFIK